MSSILREFYFGNISPHEQTNLERNSSNLKRLLKYEEMLMERLSEKDKKLFDKFMEIDLDISSEDTYTAFSDGFTLGSLFMLEVFQKGDRYTNL